MQEDDELDQVGVGLLPEGLTPAPEGVVQQAGDAVSESVGFEVIVQGIVAVGDWRLTSK